MADKSEAISTPSVTDDMEWVTISDPKTTADIKIVFEVIGDQFQGTFLGMRTIPSQEGTFKQARFSDDSGDTYFVNANYSMTEALSKVRVGSLVRVTYDDDLDTGQQNPMRVYRVDVARTSRASMRTGIRPGNIASNT